ncbi:MAG TPA: hypothetical protein EYQ24_03205 [Bacteroidetes bacterium]|nr:hypothetical protein [Bacteroidota bacterium]
MNVRVLLIALALLFAFVLADTLGLRESETGVLSPKGYVPISHGSHTHYVPNGWRGSEATGVSISAFPTTPPPEGMTVSQTGEIVPLAE